MVESLIADKELGRVLDIGRPFHRMLLRTNGIRYRFVIDMASLTEG